MRKGKSSLPAGRQESRKQKNQYREMDIILETERLRLRPFDLGDTQFIIELLNSPGWIQFIGERNVKTEEQAANYLQNGPMKSYAQNGFGLSMVERKEDDLPVGMCGILKRDTLDDPDIGFAFLPAYSGKGYAFEIAQATLDHARTKLGFHRISAITIPENERSVRLLEKIGMKFIREIQMGGNTETLLLFGNE